MCGGSAPGASVKGVGDALFAVPDFGDGRSANRRGPGGPGGPKSRGQGPGGDRPRRPGGPPKKRPNQEGGGGRGRLGTDGDYRFGR